MEVGGKDWVANGFLQTTGDCRSLGVRNNAYNEKQMSFLAFHEKDSKFRFGTGGLMHN